MFLTLSKKQRMFKSINVFVRLVRYVFVTENDKNPECSPLKCQNIVL